MRNEILALIVSMLVSIGLAIFGLVNWTCYVGPTALVVPRDSSKEHADWLRENHDRRVAEAAEGKDAVIPFAVAPPLTFVGTVAFVVSMVLLVSEYNKPPRRY